MLKKIANRIFKNFHYKLLAVVFSFLLWFLAVRQESIVLTVRLPAKVIAPQTVSVAEFQPEKLTIQIEGTKKSIEFIKEEGKILIQLPPRYTKINGLTTIPVSTSMLTLKPQLPDVSIKSVETKTIKLKIEKIVEKPVPVKVTIIGKNRKNFKVASITPNFITVYAPQSRTSKVKCVKTEPINTDYIKTNATIYVKIESPYRTFPQSVKVKLIRR
ncbi:CdaR family protein [Desulfurobacterium sp.]